MPSAARPRPAPPARWCRAAATALLVGSLVTVGGCGLRLETPPPAVPSADATEQVRQRTVGDALALGVLAASAAQGTTDPDITTLLGDLGTAADAQVTALGGLYVPFPGTSASPTPTETAPATPTGPSTGSVAPEPAADVAAVVALLTETAASSRADAAAVADGQLARLLAAVATNRLLLAEALSTAADLPAPASGDGAAGDGAPEDDAATDDDAEAASSVPAGVSSTDVLTLVRSEDAVGLAYEVVAARSADAARTSAAARAAAHRSTAEAWARTAGALGTGLDPRQASYALPAEITAPDADPAAVTAALATLEGDLAASYASLVAQAEAGARSPLVDALVDAARAQCRLTGVVPAFPGLPEQTG